MTEIAFVKAHEVRKDGPVALTVPMAFKRLLGITGGTRFVSHIEGKNIVYTPIPDNQTEE
jgi:hypothetical protein